MKPRYIIGGLIAAIALTVGIYSLDGSKIAYSDLTYAAQSGKRVQVKGTWVKEEPSNYDSRANLFTFTMKDTTGRSVRVLYNNARPNNFELAQSIVVKGRIEGDVMHADEILTKCPSKYEGNVDDLKQSAVPGASSY